MKRLFAILFMVLLLTLGLSLSASAAEVACTDLNGSNIGDQNYRWNWADTVKSYLSRQANGNWMTVTFDGDHIEASYYNSKYELLNCKTIPLDLPIFGGFYETENAFYILTGQSNPSESNLVKVYHVSKYDKNWKLTGSVGLFNCNTVSPFEAGSARFAHNGNTLVIRTCHKMYKSNDGLNHQANHTIVINTDNMTILDSAHNVEYHRFGYASHSFNQFIRFVDGQFVAVDHGDAYPRTVALFKIPNNNSSSYRDDRTDLINIPGAIGDNYTGVRVGGFEASTTHYLVAGSSELDSDGVYNIYLSTLPKSGDTPTMRYLTSYTTESTSVPHLVKLSSTRFLVMWTFQKKVYYVEVKADGTTISPVRSMDGELSDCAPIVTTAGLVTWYTYDDNDVTFYTIQTGLFNNTMKKAVNDGHTFVTKKDSTYHWEMCSRCGYSSAKTKHTTNQEFVNDGNKIKLRTTCKTCSHVVKSENISATVKETFKNGEQILTPVLKTASGKTLKNNVDYTYCHWHWWYNLPDYYIYEIEMHFYGKGQYSGTVDKVFYSLPEYEASTDIGTQTYTGKALKPTVKIKTHEKTTLKSGVDYTVTYKNNTKVGTATAVITGAGDYYGTYQKNFKIARSIAKARISGIKSKTYTGKALTQSPKVVVNGVTLKKNTDYTLSYSNNIKAGTAKVKITGKGNYTGSITKSFTIKPISISTCKIKLSATKLTYNGKVRSPSVVVKNAKGTTLKKNTHYTVTYAKGRKSVGTYKVTVKMKGNYSGSKVLTFKINPIPVTKCSVKLSTSSYTYNGKTKTPNVIVRNQYGTKLKKGSHYTVTYAKGRKSVGTYKITVKMKGNYGGTKTLTLKILPPKTAVSKITPKTKALKITLVKKSTQVTGYQVQYSTSKKFTSPKTKTITSYKTTSTTLTKLKAKKTYYVRVRTYKMVGGKRIYSLWSAVKSSKTK